MASKKNQHGKSNPGFNSSISSCSCKISSHHIVVILIGPTVWSLAINESLFCQRSSSYTIQYCKCVAYKLRSGIWLINRHILQRGKVRYVRIGPRNQIRAYHVDNSLSRLKPTHKSAAGWPPSKESMELVSKLLLLLIYVSAWKIKFSCYIKQKMSNKKFYKCLWVALRTSKLNLTT